MLKSPYYSTKQSSKPYIFSFLCSEDSLRSPKRLERRLAQKFGGYFCIKEEGASKRKRGLYTRCPPNNEGVRGIFVLSSKEL